MDADDVRAVAEAVLAPVLADLRATGGAPVLELRREPSNRESVLAWLVGSDGIAHVGVWIQLAAPVEEQVERAADQVQEWAIEELWREGRSATWPECPDHPNAHPLELFGGDRENRAVWRCPRTSRVIGTLGTLSGPAAE